MGVSVSASTAIIVAGLFFAFTAFYPVASNGFERVSAASHDVNERALERQNTGVDVTTATFDGDANDGDGEIVVNATNDGSNGLVVSDTTLIVDNEYVDLAAVETSVDDDGDTDLWLAGEQLQVTISGTDLETDVDDETRVVLVTEPGVRDTAVVTDETGGA